MSPFSAMRLENVVHCFEWADRWQNPGHSVRSSSAASTGRILTKPKLAEADGQTS